MRLFVLGCANIDLTFRVSGMPRRGVTEVCPYQLGFGGKGANQAVQAARLGASVTFCAKVGDDPFGPAIIEQLRRERIDTEYVTAALGLPSGTAIILVEPSGQNSIITHAGPNVLLTAEDVQRGLPAIQAADIFLATLEVNAEPLFAAFRAAQAAGIRTILNPAPPVDFPHSLLELVDICVPNESELVALTGLNCGTMSDVHQAAESLRQLGPNTVVVTLGERGAFLLDDEGSAIITSQKVESVDTSGAGDAFTAALAVALGEGKTLREAAQFANTVAALSVTRPGTQSSFPSRAEV